MKADVMFSSKSDNWATPQWLFDQLHAEFDFTLDVCADAQNAKCHSFFSQEQDGLSQVWNGRVWCNPPHGRVIGNWVKKCAEYAQGGGLLLCCSPPARTPGGFMNTYMEKRKSASSVVGCGSVMRLRTLRSPA